MPFKIKRDAIFMSDVRLGSLSSLGGGTSVSSLLAGSATMATSSISAGSYEAASITISGLTTGHKVWLSGCTSSCEVAVVAACATAANTLAVTYLNAGSATAGASSLTVYYLAIRDA